MWKRIVFLATFCSMTDPFELKNSYPNLTNFTVFNHYYKSLLHDIRQHRSLDTVASPIDVEKIRQGRYDQEYLKTSCYANAKDLLIAHNYNISHIELTIDDIESLLPAVLYAVFNPGCERQSPVLPRYRFFDVWVLGLILLIIIKLFHSVLFYHFRKHSFIFLSGIRSQSSSPSVRYAPWLGLGLDGFICGNMLGTIMYHLIPHIYHVPDEDYEYTYLYRGSVLLFGILLFLFMEKILRLRFCVDQIQAKLRTRSMDTPMISMTRVSRDYAEPNREQNAVDQSKLLLTNGDHPAEITELPTGKSNRSLPADLVYDLSHDLIYGFGLSSTFVYDHLSGFVLLLLIFCEGIRRYSKEKSGFPSVIVLVVGYIIGGILIEIQEQFQIQMDYLEKEYIYSVLYGTVFYSALGTLMSESDQIINHLQSDQRTVEERRWIKTRIFLCQSFTILLGVCLTLVLAIVWRYYHRLLISGYVCPRDSSRSFCS